MPELIERDALKNHLYRAQAEAFKRSEWYVAGAIQSFIDILDKQPTIEAEPVRHGRWILKILPIGGGDKIRSYLCSECDRYTNMKFDFCPNCGARMDLRTPTEVQLDEADSVMMGGAENG